MLFQNVSKRLAMHEICVVQRNRGGWGGRDWIEIHRRFVELQPNGKRFFCIIIDYVHLIVHTNS